MSQKTEIDLIITTSWVVPIIPRNCILEDYSVAIHEGKIIAIAQLSDLQAQYESQQHLDLTGHVLIPGLINAHGHAAMSLLRGYADDKPLMEWLEQHIWPAEQTWVSEKFIQDGTQLAMAEMIATGTTCFSDMYFFPEHSSAAADEAGMRAQINFPVLDFPTIWAKDADEYLNKGMALSEQYNDHALINIGFGPHAPYTVSDEPLQKISEYAAQYQASIQIHLHETAFEVASSIESVGKRPIHRLNDLGLLSTRTQCVHMTQVDDTDIELLKQSGAHVVHCPESNLKLASGLCPTDRLLKAGVNVCLGTDGAASNNDLDLLGEIRSAALIGKVTADNASAIDAMTALEMATINGAKAMAIDDIVGSIEIGKQADLVTIDLSGIEHQPVHNPISQLVYSQVSHKVSHVWVNGQLLLENRQHKTLDIDAIIAKAKQWQHKLSAK